MKRPAPPPVPKPDATTFARLRQSENRELLFAGAVVLFLLFSIAVCYLVLAFLPAV